jgi:glycosyltransferase involved in cell wall biosynthesis
MRRLRVALVHDWLTGYRGGERVLDCLARRFPDADLYTLVHARGTTSPAIDALDIRTSALDRLPGIHTHYRKFLPLFPWAIRGFELRGYDLVLSTHHAVAKGIRVAGGTPHLCYCFTPMRYVWDQTESYLGDGLRRRMATPFVNALRRFDVETSRSEQVSRFLAISSDVSSRIRRHYGREARVLAPPVDLSWIPRPSEDQASPHDYYLHVGGFVPYKRDDLVLDTFRQLDRRLVVVGDGPTRRRLERSRPPNVEFVGRVDDDQLAALYRDARALVYPQHEDFGLVALEAQAAGTPVIAFGRGGVLDSVRPLRSEQLSTSEPLDATGVFFDRQTRASLAEAIETFEKAEPRFDPAALRRWAARFSPDRFLETLDCEIASLVGESA